MRIKIEAGRPCGTLERNDHCTARLVASDIGEGGAHSRCNLKIKSTEYVVMLDIEAFKKRTGIKDDAKVSGLSSWKDRTSLAQVKKAMEEGDYDGRLPVLCCLTKSLSFYFINKEPDARVKTC